MAKPTAPAGADRAIPRPSPVLPVRGVGPEAVERPQLDLCLDARRHEAGAEREERLAVDAPREPDASGPREPVRQRVDGGRRLRVPLGLGDMRREGEPVAALEERVEERERLGGRVQHSRARRTEDVARIVATVESPAEAVGVDRVGELEVREALPVVAVERHPEVVVRSAAAEVVLEDAAEDAFLGLERQSVGDHPVQREVVAVAAERRLDVGLEDLFFRLVLADVRVGFESGEGVEARHGETGERQVERAGAPVGEVGEGHEARSGEGRLLRSCRRVLRRRREPLRPWAPGRR